MSLGRRNYLLLAYLIVCCCETVAYSLLGFVEETRVACECHLKLELVQVFLHIHDVRYLEEWSSENIMFLINFISICKLHNLQHKSI